ncbi:MAG: PAS domain S-box protein [Hyphomicrobiales bacterium]
MTDASARDLLCVLGPDGRTRYANGALRALLGLPPTGDLPPRLHPDDITLLSGLRTGQPPRDLALRFRSAEGGWIRAQLRCHAIGPGAPRVLAASPELTAPDDPSRPPWAKRDAPVGIYIIRDGHFAYVNPRFEHITGYSAAELLGMRAMDLVLPEDRRQLRRQAARVIAGDRWVQYDYRIRTRSGRVRTLAENVTPLRGHGLRATLGSCLDITARSRAAEALREGDRRLGDITANTQDLLALTGPAGRFLFVNNAHADVLGYRPLELLGLPAQSLVHPDDRPMVMEMMATASLEPVTVEIRAAHRDGHWVWLETQIEVINDGYGNYNGTVLLSRDTTARRRVQQELGRIAAELRAPVEAMASFAYAAARGDAPALSLVSAYAEALARTYHAHGSDPDAFIRGLGEETARLQALIADLLSSAASGGQSQLKAA